MRKTRDSFKVKLNEIKLPFENGGTFSLEEILHLYMADSIHSYEQTTAGKNSERVQEELRTYL